MKALLEGQTLEYSQLIGSAIDPRKPYPKLMTMIGNVQTILPEEHLYYMQKAKNADKIYVVTSTGALTELAVSPTADSELTFIDIVTPLKQVKLNALATSKEATIARIKLDIERELDGYELRYATSLMEAAAVSTGNQVTLGSGVTTFNFSHVVDMCSMVEDYGNGFQLILGRDCMNDFRRWNYVDNKNVDIMKSFELMGVAAPVSMPNQTASVDGAGATSIFGSTKGYLVANADNTGNAGFEFARRRIDDIKDLGAAVMADGSKPERPVISQMCPITVSGTVYMGVGFTGWEHFVGACTNKYVVANFTRS